MSSLFKMKVDQDVEKFFKSTFAENCRAGPGFFYNCALVDALMSGAVFGIIILLSDALSKKFSRTYQRLNKHERLDWILLFANWCLSISSITGSLYILFNNEWFMNPSSSLLEKFPPKLDFFLPWMIGYNLGRIIYVLIGCSRGDEDIVLPDTVPHILLITLYGIILENRIFGMLAVFQILVQSRHFLESPLNLMQYMKYTKSIFYKTLDRISFTINMFSLSLAGPYCMAILFYQWGLLAKFTWFTKLIFVCQVLINTIFFVGDGIYVIYAAYALIVGSDPNYYIKKIKQKTKEISRQNTRQQHASGYEHVEQDNEQNDSDDDDENLDNNEINDDNKENDNNIELGSNFVNPKNKSKFKNQNMSQATHENKNKGDSDYQKQQ